MRNYEFTVIFDTADDNVTTGKELISQGFKANNVTVEKEDDLGIKFLAYPIKKNDKGHYFYYELQAEPDSIAKMENTFRLHDPVLKFLFVKKDK
ncbi:MAG: 30S ribosomal protein S6 [Spirochaetota bacterium]